MTKFEIAISTLLIGFMLGQAVDFIKYRWGIYRKKKGISDEVLDILDEFKFKAKRIEEILNDINSVALSGIVTPSSISHVIFDNHYADVAPFYTRKERAELASIYKCVENFNKELASGERKGISSSNNSFISLYAQCHMGIGSVEHYQRYKGEKSLNDNKEELDRIRLSIQKLADKYHI
ncbi:hypothetical protein U0N67_004784 [Vibrio parahaemolyticus]|nr:hypothetical protein [Vibrio parahaemolyticus]ELZ7200881.1 hypothetical protein [Vibrio parahaemolyticus]MBE3821604.1 hypothetical protein [Vibrio parahaemolyticus]MBM5119642.1 hypothetical protein [Vibrio parahaemolyticus]MBM5124224.1 hypothetical protein [Vibrio parahaemolyticus]